MVINEFEIASSIRQALHKKQQVRIEAELNSITKDEVLDIVRRYGISLEPPKPKKKPRYKPVKQKKTRKVYDHDEFKRLYGLGLNDCEIARQTNATGSAVAQWRHREGLPAKAKRGFQHKAAVANG